MSSVSWNYSWKYIWNIIGEYQRHKDITIIFRTLMAIDLTGYDISKFFYLHALRIMHFLKLAYVAYVKETFAQIHEADW